MRGEQMNRGLRKAYTKTINPSLLNDAVKTKIYVKGYALLEWNFDTTKNYKCARGSALLPEEIIDLILHWRDKKNEKRDQF